MRICLQSLRSTHWLLAVLCIGLGTAYLAADDANKESAAKSDTAVESDMHEFMEYMFEPAYLRLKERLAAAPGDTVAWKAVKSDSLILAEATNLLPGRGPDSDQDEWNSIAADVRKAGAAVYQAGKKKDYAAARSSYEAMISKCNACHQKFADGEHQLKP